MSGCSSPGPSSSSFLISTSFTQRPCEALKARTEGPALRRLQHARVAFAWTINPGSGVPYTDGPDRHSCMLTVGCARSR